MRINWHATANNAIQAVNPNVSAELQVFSGYTTAADGSRTPAYLPSVTISAQVQALTADELNQLDGVNLSGEKRAMYLYGRVLGVLRLAGAGGDLITLPDNTVWLVVQVLEQWNSANEPTWCKVAVTRQLP